MSTHKKDIGNNILHVIEYCQAESWREAEQLTGERSFVETLLKHGTFRHKCTKSRTFITTKAETSATFNIGGVIGDLQRLYCRVLAKHLLLDLLPLSTEWAVEEWEQSAQQARRDYLANLFGEDTIIGIEEDLTNFFIERISVPGLTDNYWGFGKMKQKFYELQGQYALELCVLGDGNVLHLDYGSEMSERFSLRRFHESMWECFLKTAVLRGHKQTPDTPTLRGLVNFLQKKCESFMLVRNQYDGPLLDPRNMGSEPLKALNVINKAVYYAVANPHCKLGQHMVAWSAEEDMPGVFTGEEINIPPSPQYPSPPPPAAEAEAEEEEETGEKQRTEVDDLCEMFADEPEMVAELKQEQATEETGETLQNATETEDLEQMFAEDQAILEEMRRERAAEAAEARQLTAQQKEDAKKNAEAKKKPKKKIKKKKFVKKKVATPEAAEDNGAAAE